MKVLPLWEVFHLANKQNLMVQFYQHGKQTKCLFLLFLFRPFKLLQEYTASFTNPAVSSSTNILKYILTLMSTSLNTNVNLQANKLGHRKRPHSQKPKHFDVCMQKNNPTAEAGWSFAQLFLEISLLPEGLSTELWHSTCHSIGPLWDFCLWFHPKCVSRTPKERHWKVFGILLLICPTLPLIPAVSICHLNLRHTNNQKRHKGGGEAAGLKSVWLCARPRYGQDTPGSGPRELGPAHYATVSRQRGTAKGEREEAVRWKTAWVSKMRAGQKFGRWEWRDRRDGERGL